MVGRGRAGEDELPLLGRLIYLVAHCVPEGRHLLPLVDEAGRLPLQHQGGGQFRQLAVLEVPSGVADVDLTFAVVGRGPGLAAPFWPLDADGTKGGQVFLHLPVNDTGLVVLLIHKRSPRL